MKFPLKSLAGMAATVLAISAVTDAAFAQAPVTASPTLPADPSVPLPTVEAPADAPPDNVIDGVLGEGGLLDSQNPDMVVTIRAGVDMSPSYFGSDDYLAGPDFSVRFDFVQLPGGLTYGSSRTVGFRSGWGLQGSFRYVGGRDGDDEIEGLDDVDWSAEAGLGVGYEQRNWRVFTDVRYGFVGHNAWVGEIGADSIAYPVEGLTLTAGPRLSFGDDRFADTYFGISPSESAASGLDAYQADGGLLGAGIQLGARYLFNERWGVEGAAGWQRLLNSAADSPVVDLGSEDQYSFRVGITRRISLDF